MKVLCIDFGTKFVGVAVGDTEIKIATPHKTIPYRQKSELIEKLREVVKDTQGSKIVMGLPLNFKMEETEASRKVREFGKQLQEEFGLPVEYENEILTSTQVEREIGRKNHAAAAALILQSWLDRPRKANHSLN